MISLQEIKRFHEELSHIDVTDFAKNLKNRKKNGKKRK